MEKFVRICPQCGKDIEHKTKASMKDAIRRNQLCRKCGCNKPERLSIQREINSGERNPFFGKKHSEETKKHWSASKKGKMPELLLERIRSGICANKGIKNGMYGKSVYSVWLQKYGKEEADRRKLEMENKKRETFKKNYNPSKHKSPPYGCGNGWGGWYKNWYFRSLRELSYMIKVIEKDGLSWESGESWQN